MIARLPRYSALLGAVAIGSCGPVPESQPGTLGNGTFAYNCTTTQDAFCPGASTPASGATFPNIAYGGQFQFTFTANDSSSVPVRPASAAFFSGDSPSFQALLVGKPWFVAVTPSGLALDLATVTVEPVASIQIAETTSAPAVTGSSHTYGGTPMGTVGALAGTVSFTWVSSDEEVVQIQASNGGAPSSTVDVSFVKAGTATLTAYTTTARGTLTLSVSEGS